MTETRLDWRAERVPLLVEPVLRREIGTKELSEPVEMRIGLIAAAMTVDVEASAWYWLYSWVSVPDNKSLTVRLRPEKGETKWRCGSRGGYAVDCVVGMAMSRAGQEQDGRRAQLVASSSGAHSTS